MNILMNSLTFAYKICILFVAILTSSCQVNNHYTFMGCDWRLPDSVELQANRSKDNATTKRVYFSKNSSARLMQITFYDKSVEEYIETSSKNLVSEDVRKGFYIKRYEIREEFSEIIFSMQTISKENKFILLFNVNDSEINTMLSHCTTK